MTQNTGCWQDIVHIYRHEQIQKLEGCHVLENTVDMVECFRGSHYFKV
jgi:hypothetical protein